MQRLRPARRARDARHRLARDHVPRDARRAARRPNGGVYICRWAISGPTTCAGSSRAWSSAAPIAASTSPAGCVEVVPTAHYMMGGVVFRPDCTTALTGLFAAGEDTGGVHGANRLGGNGVANSTVFGGIAGDAMAAWVRAKPHSRARRGGDRDERGRARAPFGQAAGRPRRDPRGALRHACGTTSASCATREGLARAVATLDELDAELDAMRRRRRRAAPSISPGTTGSISRT